MDGDAAPPGYVRAVELAAALGRDGRRVNEWCRRRASRTGAALVYLVGATGGRELWVPATLADAAVAHFRRAATQGHRAAPGGDESATLSADAPAPGGAAQMPQDLAERLAALTARAEVAEARLADLGAEAERLRAALADERQAHLAATVREGRADERLAAWREWGRLTLAALAGWRRWRRVPAVPPQPDTGTAPRLGG